MIKPVGIRLTPLKTQPNFKSVAQYSEGGAPEQMDLMRGENSPYSSLANYEQPIYNNVDYSGYKLSKSGTLYKESNSWKTYAPMVGAVMGAINAFSADKALSQLPSSPMMKAMRAFSFTCLVIQNALLWLGIGTIIDKCIDSSRAKRADELASISSQQLYY